MIMQSPNIPHTVTYTVFPIPIPASSEHVDRWIAIRLTGLQVDPSSFRTTFQNASKYPREDNIKRINNPNAYTVVAAAGDTEISPWVATAAMLISTDETITHLPVVARQEGRRAFFLAGLWVHPDHRRRGLAKRMFESALEWVKSCPTEEEGKYVAVEVYKDNPAKNLYETLGFMEVEEHEEGGRSVIWLSMHVD